MLKKIILGLVVILAFAASGSRTSKAAAAAGQLSLGGLLAPTPVEPVATQEISLAAGWNLISSYVDPADPDLDVVLAGIAADVVLIKNGDGQVYWPAYGVDQIGAWDVRQGYQIYMKNEATLSIIGILVSLADTPISLSGGWNMIAYSRDLTQLASEALDTISGQLTLAKDGDGLVYWPDLVIDHIGYMQPGKGYQVYMDAAGTLLYPDGAATTSPSLIMSGAISVPGEFDSFVFSAEGGDSIIAGLTRTSGQGWPKMELFDSDGNLLSFIVPGVHGEMIYNIPVTAVYRIAISHATIGDSFTYNLFLQRLNNPAGAVSIGYSDILSGSIVEAAEMDAFTFEAQAGDAIISGLTRTAGDIAPDIRLYDSSGNRLAWDPLDPTHAEIIYNITATAQYTILVSHNSGEGAYNYNLFLQRFNNPAGAVSIGYSDILSGSIVEAAEMDAFTFDAQAGDAIISGLTRTAGDIAPDIRLYDSSGNRLAWDPLDPTHAEIIYNITATAQYTILVSHNSGEGAYNYNLFLQRFNNPAGAVSIGYSDILSGSIVEAAEMDAFTFDAQAGDAIIAGLTRTAGDIAPDLRLYDSSGNRLAWDPLDPTHAEIVYNIAETAQYTILVSHNTGESAYNYNLFLQRFNNPAGAVSIGYSDILSGSIVEAAEMDAFTFDAQAGDAIIAGLTRTAGDIAPDLRLYDSSGNRLAWDPLAPTHAEIVYNIAETAQYTILVSHNTGEGAYNYNLFLQRTNNPVGATAAVYSGNYAGAIVQAAEMDALTFTAQAGDAIIISATKTSGPAWIDLRLYNAAGDVLGHIAPTVHGEIKENITETGVYTILVSHSSGEGALDYNLFLQRFNNPAGAASIAYSDNLTGAIVEPAEMDAFTFTAQAGDAVIAAATRTSGVSWLLLRIYDSTGNMLAAVGPPTHGEITLNITQTAEYTILVSHSTGESAFDYNLFLQRFNNPVSATNIGYFEVHHGSVVEPAEMDAFTFNAQDGEGIIAGLTNITGTSFADIELYDSSGNWLAGASTTSSADITYDITETAEYTILVSSSSGEDAFDYELSLDLDN